MVNTGYNINNIINIIKSNIIVYSKLLDIKAPIPFSKSFIVLNLMVNKKVYFKAIKMNIIKKERNVAQIAISVVGNIATAATNVTGNYSLDYLYNYRLTLPDKYTNLLG